jgi:hypothetical protein
LKILFASGNIVNIRNINADAIPLAVNSNRNNAIIDR